MSNQAPLIGPGRRPAAPVRIDPQTGRWTDGAALLPRQHPLGWLLPGERWVDADGQTWTVVAVKTFPSGHVQVESHR